MTQNGKGSAPRPLSVSNNVYKTNWERIFNNKTEICEYSGLRSVSSYEDSTPVDETYQAMIKSGMFWELFPHLSGTWEIDKEHWVEHMIRESK